MKWYAVAFDVAGGIHAWSGPHRWSKARAVVIGYEQSDCVRLARVQKWQPAMVEWNRRAA